MISVISKCKDNTIFVTLKMGDGQTQKNIQLKMTEEELRSLIFQLSAIEQDMSICLSDLQETCCGNQSR